MMMMIIADHDENVGIADVRLEDVIEQIDPDNENDVILLDYEFARI